MIWHSYIFCDFDVKIAVKVEKQSISHTLMILFCLLHLLNKCEVTRIREVSLISCFFDVKSISRFEISQISMIESSIRKCEAFNIEYQCVRSLVRLLKFECEIVDLKKIQTFFWMFSMIEKASKERLNQTRRWMNSYKYRNLFVLFLSKISILYINILICNLRTHSNIR